MFFGRIGELASLVLQPLQFTKLVRGSVSRTESEVSIAG